MTTGPLPAPPKCKSGRFNVPRVIKTKFPATVMVLGVVSSEGHIMPPHIFEVGLKVNTKVYLDVLKSVVIPWCNRVAGGRPWMWQQDSAQAHKSKENQAWLQKECYNFVPFSTYKVTRDGLTCHWNERWNTLCASYIYIYIYIYIQWEWETERQTDRQREKLRQRELVSVGVIQWYIISFTHMQREEKERVRFIRNPPYSPTWRTKSSAVQGNSSSLKKRENHINFQI